MAKTRSQSIPISIKKEHDESKEELKYAQLLKSNNTTQKSSGKITKTRKTKTNSLIVSKPELKQEVDGKNLLHAPKSKAQRKPVTQEEINQLIGYVKNDKLTLKAASSKVNMSVTSAYKYYKRYRDDPEYKMPQAKKRNPDGYRYYTQDKINAIITNIVNKKKSKSEIARILNIDIRSITKYYNMYQDDPEHKIPQPWSSRSSKKKICTQDQIHSLIRYLVDDNMSVMAAARKANMGEHTAHKYYKAYLKDPKRRIPQPMKKTIQTKKNYSQSQINDFFEYINKDNLSILQASKRASIKTTTAYKYYYMYSTDPDHRIPQVHTQAGSITKRFTSAQVTTFLHYIINGELSVTEASRKLNMSINTGRRYYARYLKDPDHYIDSTRMIQPLILQEQVNDLITYIVHDGMEIKSAAKKTNMSYSSAYRYYKKYLDGSKS